MITIMSKNEENGEDCVVDNLYCKIEYLRQKMHVIALAKGISHSEVLMISCELDEVLNFIEYL